MELAKFSDSRCVSTMQSTKEVFGLVLELSKVRANGKVTFRHTSLLCMDPRFANAGKKEVRKNRNVLWLRSGGLSPTREREASCTPSEGYCEFMRNVNSRRKRLSGKRNRGARREEFTFWVYIFMPPPSLSHTFQNSAI